MNYPLISEYIEAIRSAENNFGKLSNLRPILDDNGNPVMLMGNFAVVFKMEDTDTNKLYAVKCFTREQEEREERYKEIIKTLDKVHSPYIVSTKYLDKELLVDTTQSNKTKYPIVVMDWVEGICLDVYLQNIKGNKLKRELLANEFQKFVCWLLPKPFAHGDLNPDNILIKEDGSIVLVDYDGMFVPSLYGKSSLEIDTSMFQYKRESLLDFNEYIDDYAAILLLLILKVNAISAVDFEDYLLENNTEVIKKCEPYLNDKTIAPLLSAYIMVSTFGRIDRQQIYCLLTDNSDFDAQKEIELLYAARKGDTVAMLNLGNLYRRGIYVPKNDSKAIQWYELALRLGNVNATCRLCQCYTRGEDFGFTPKNSILLDFLVKHKTNFAYCRKGEDYFFGLGVKRDLNKAVNLWNKAVKIGTPCAQRWLGTCYEYGYGAKKDLDKALSLLIKAAKAGDSSAQYFLGCNYANGKGVEKDFKKAIYWLKKAAEAGHSSAQHVLGNHYENGQGVKKDLKKATYWYQKAAEQGYTAAQYCLGICYDKGEGAEKDFNKAIYWLQKAAEKGYAAAQYYLGFCYDRGEWGERDLDKAIYWLQKAAEKGYAAAQYYLGICYDSSEWGEKDLDKAIYWLQKAAEKGYAAAQYHLGIYHDRDEDGRERFK